MDNLIEYLYKKKNKIIDYVIQVLIVIASITIATFLFLLFTIILVNAKLINVFLGGMLGLLSVVFCVYYGYKFFLKFNIEYEYIYFAGEIDFDRIYSKTIRDRLVSVKCSKFEKFGEFNDDIKNQLKDEEFNKLFNFSSNTDKTQYYAVFKHPDFKKTIIIFEPPVEMLNDMKKYIRNNRFNSYNNE